MREVPSHEDAEIHEFLAAGAARQAELLERWGFPRAVVLMLFNACEARCFFCANPGTVAVPDDQRTRWAAMEQHLRGRPVGETRLLVGGNEPLLHPDIDRAFALAAELGFTWIELMTSGLQLAHPERLARWVEHGLRSVAVPIYSQDPTLHDAICGVPCHARLLAGLDAARDAGVQIWLHTLALRRNVDELDALARWAGERWGAPVAVAPLREKDGLFRYDPENVPLAELQERLPGMSPNLHLVGMPACLDRGRARGSATVIEMYFRTQRREHAPVCAGCADRKGCPGVVAAQLRRWGEQGLVAR